MAASVAALSFADRAFREWLERAALTLHSSDPIGHEPIDESDPVVQALVFTRKFVPTYYLALSVILIVSAARYLRRKTRLEIPVKHGHPSATSSSSGTLQGTSNPLSKSNSYTELSSLLGHDNSQSVSTGRFDRAWCHFKYFLAYQPRPIFAFTADQNRLPSNGTSLMVTVLLMINIFYLFYRNRLSMANVQSFGDRAGLLFAANLPVLYVLAVKNQKPLRGTGWSFQDLTGWSYEGLNIFHRRLGEWMVTLAVIHVSSMFTLWYNLFRPLGYSLSSFLSLKIIVLGIGIITCIVLLWVLSMGYVRQRRYEVFLASHIVLQLVALSFLFFHHRNARPYVAAALAIWALDRLLFRTINREKFVATLEVAADGKTVLLFCDIPIQPTRWVRSIRSGWKPGQHVFLAVRGIGRHYRYQAHPFSIASPAPSPRATNCPFQLIIRARDGFSRDLLEYARFHQHTEVEIDGPYGSTDALDAVMAADRTCLIAGGSGIAATWPLSWIIFTQNRSTPIVSSRKVYFNGQKIEPVLQRMRRSDLAQDDNIHFWVRQEESNDTWLTMHPLIDGESGQPPETCFGDNQVVDLIDRSFETRGGTHNRPDITSEVLQWAERSTAIDVKTRTISIIGCGPPSLNANIRNCAAQLTLRGYRVRTVIEQFGW